MLTTSSVSWFITEQTSVLLAFDALKFWVSFPSLWTQILPVVLNTQPLFCISTFFALEWPQAAEQMYPSGRSFWSGLRPLWGWSYWPFWSGPIRNHSNIYRLPHNKKGQAPPPPPGWPYIKAPAEHMISTITTVIPLWLLTAHGERGCQRAVIYQWAGRDWLALCVPLTGT